MVGNWGSAYGSDCKLLNIFLDKKERLLQWVVIKEKPIMTNNLRAIELLEAFRREKSWDNFLPVLAELDERIKKKVGYFMSWFRGHEEAEDLVSQIQLYLYDLVERYNPEKGVSILRFVDYNLGVYLQNLRKVIQRRAEKVGYTADFTAYSKRGESLEALIDVLKDELSESSISFLREIQRDEETMQLVIDCAHGRACRRAGGVVDRRRLSRRLQILVCEIQELMAIKNLRIA